MAKGRERGREQREREGTDVYLAFPIPAQRLVSCLLSLSLFLSPSLALPYAGLSSLMEHIERGYESVRTEGVGAGVRGRAEREANERHSKLGMLGRRGPWTTLSTAAGGETTPPRPTNGGQTGERHRGMTKGEVRGAVDNNNYYTRRSFANAVLRGWLATRGGKKGRSVDGVGAGNGRPLSRPVTQAGAAEEG